MDVVVRRESTFLSGRIKKVDEYHKRCRVSFGDGSDEAWASFKVNNHGNVFLDAPSHLYKRSCPSVRPSVGP